MDLGRYVVFDEIAVGGMSSVHFGRMLGPAGFGKTVAIKRLHRHLATDPELVSMMIDEARLVSRIHHPNVASTIDVVHTKSDLFIVMEYVPGETLANLARVCREGNVPIPESVALAITLNMLLGLDAAHEATAEDGTPLGIVHRDVSPQNVFVGTDGSARLLDFGIARAAGTSHHSDGGQLKGKMAYMSPEQIELAPELDRRTDIYGASVVLWELLTGRRLFDCPDKAQLKFLILSGAVRSPRAFLPALADDLEEVVMRGLESSMTARYATAREMAACLERCGRVATAREVAAWVAETASVAIAERATKVAEIERETASVLDLRALATQIARGDGELSAPRSEQNRASVSTLASVTSAPRRGSSSRALIATAVLTALAVCAISVYRIRSVVPWAPAAGAAKPADTDPAPTSPVVAPSTFAPPEAPPASSGPSAAAAAPSVSGGPRPLTPRAARSAAEHGSRPAPSPRGAAQRPSSPPGNDLFDRN